MTLEAISRSARSLLALLLASILFVGCSLSPDLTPTQTPATPVATTPAPTPMAVRAIADSGSPTVGGTAAADSAGQAVQAAVLKGNLEQVQAVKSADPTVMKDTSTGSYYDQAVKGNQDLLSGGATSIALLQLNWGPVSIDGNSAQATTYEWWETGYDDGSTEIQEDVQNTYSLTQTGGTWLISADNHPSNGPIGRGLGNPFRRSATPTPAPAAATPSADRSRNWAGYTTTNGPFTSVAGTWTIPHVDASQGSSLTAQFNPATDATWIGIGGVNTDDLIQAGSDATVVGQGDTVYTTWIETLPDASRQVALAVLPGDSLTVTITEKQANTWDVLLTNSTSGQSYHETVGYQSSHSSAEWVEEAPSSGNRILPLDRFGVVQFTAGSAVRNGNTVSLAGAGAEPVTMTQGGLGRQPIAVPSGLGSDGSSFSVTRL